jgi:HD-GYP domain-containing protein (c-di-GMP phosphodiesterase class II)
MTPIRFNSFLDRITANHSGENFMQNTIKILGANGSKSVNKNSTCIQVDENILIDAGNILSALKEKAQYIDHIFITHSHLDHIFEIPFLIDSYFTQRQTPLIIYGLKETLEHLQKFIFNWQIWPDFSEIELIHKKFNAIKFQEITLGETIQFENCSLKAVKNNHTTSSCGYVISKNDHALLFSSDTFICPSLFEEINQNKKIKSAIFDISFPSSFEKLAQDSKHFTAKIFKEQLELLQRKDVRIYINHLKPSFYETVQKEILDANILLNDGAILKDGDILTLDNSQTIINEEAKQKQEIQDLIEIGYSLTSEKNFDVLMEKILLVAKNFTNADAGTLYLVDEQSLVFTVVQTDSLGIKMGGTQDKITWPKLPLYIDNKPNKEMVAALCALENKLINIKDVYTEQGFNFEGTKNFDKNTGYKTQSMLVVPMVNHEGDVIGVLQLLNKQDEHHNTIEFTAEDEKLILSMGSQAAISISNRELIDDLENLLNSFIKTIATAIDEKSPYTGGHIGRVAEIAEMFVDAINEDDTFYKDKFYNEDEKKEIKTAAWMHDIGKITTPEYVVDKARKLQTIHDRISEVEVRFELLKKEKELSFFKAMSLCNTREAQVALEEQFQEEIAQLNDDFDFLVVCNTGGEFMEDAKIQRIEEIAQKSVTINGKSHPLLTPNEIYNLSIKKGTLTNEERLVINNHSLISIKMLESLPFPKKLKEIPRIAGGHHEKICGGGYPFNLKGDEISFEARILAIADIFEALTAHDRPYKDANSLNQSMKILSFMAKDNELDKDLIKFFVKKGLHLKYAHKYLKPSQMDEIQVDFDKL